MSRRRRCAIWHDSERSTIILGARTLAGWWALRLQAFLSTCRTMPPHRAWAYARQQYRECTALRPSRRAVWSLGWW